jgi:DNA-binding transcriptional LysR family regulator
MEATRMTLTELRYIVALHQTGHFGKAADRCHVSQPTLSIAIKKLEDELQVAIFERSRNQVHATPLGLKIIAQAQAVLEQAHHIRELAAQGKDPLGSRLSVGAIFTVGPYLFPHFVPELRKLAPNMPLYIEESYTGVLREKLRSSELDAIIIALPFTEADVVTQSLYEEPFVVVMPGDHPLAAEKAITPGIGLPRPEEKYRPRRHPIAVGGRGQLAGNPETHGGLAARHHRAAAFRRADHSLWPGYTGNSALRRTGSAAHGGAGLARELSTPPGDRHSQPGHSPVPTGLMRG